MFCKPLLAVFVLANLSSAALAQSFSGGNLSIDAYGYSDGADDVSINYSGALEYSVNRALSVAVDVSQYDSTILNDDITNVTVHGLYHLGDGASLGFFAGQDYTNTRGGTFYGLEGGLETGAFAAEGYVSVYDNTESSTVLGVSGAYKFNQSVSAIADIGLAKVASESYTRLSAGAEYQIVDGPSIYAEIGNIDGGNQDGRFIGLGVNLDFGVDRGTTFGRRSIWETAKLAF
jgi:hypothetical protein